MSQVSCPGSMEISPAIPINFNTDVGVATSSGNTINFFGGAGVNVSGSGNTVTITMESLGFTWLSVTSDDSPVQMAKNRGYIVTGLSLVTFILPPSADIGDQFIVLGVNTNWKIVQNPAQYINIGIERTTFGVAGEASSTNPTDSIKLICVLDDIEFYSFGVNGNINLI